ncbi:MAG: HAD family phosphatase [Bacteroidales bacterium]|nr:HAD family phosphatase [Bacteroidales bacterium]
MNLTQGVDTIIFDLGGVIIDLDRDNAVRKFTEAGIANAADMLSSYHQEGIFQQLEEGSISRDDFYKEFCKLAGKEVSHDKIDAGWLGFIGGVQQYKLDMLEELRKKYTLYLLSNTNPVVMEWACSPRFSKTGKPLDEYFDKLYLSYKIGCMKPKKEIFEHILKDSGVTPEKTLFIDDGAENCRVAESFGFRSFKPENKEDFRYIFQ